MPFIRNPKAGDSLPPGIAFPSVDASPSDVVAQFSGLPNRQQQPPPQQLIPQTGSYPSYILRRIEIAHKFGCEYQLDNDDIKRVEFERFKQVFKDSFVRNVTMLRRIRHRRPGESQYSEWLAFYVTDSIWDDAGQEHQLHDWIGVEQEPIPQVKYNQLREVQSINFDQKRVHYTIPWSKENVDAALQDSLIIPTDLCIGYAPTMATNDIWSGNELTIHNLDELVEFPFDVLERANQGGWIGKPYGGVNSMLKAEQEDEQREKELGPNMFSHMPPVQQMKQDVRKHEAQQARMRRQEQQASRERQAEAHQVEEEKHQEQKEKAPA